MFVDIVAYELTHADDGELLSEFCDRLIERSPVARFFIIGLGTVLTLHLANLLSPRYDVISVEFWRAAHRFTSEVKSSKFSPTRRSLVSEANSISGVSSPLREESSNVFLP